jgi:hypothetical protein
MAGLPVVCPAGNLGLEIDYQIASFSLAFHRPI